MLRASRFQVAWTPYKKDRTPERLAFVLRRAEEFVAAQRQRRIRRAKLAAAKAAKAAAPNLPQGAVAQAQVSQPINNGKGQRGQKRVDRGSSGSSTPKPPPKVLREDPPALPQVRPPLLLRLKKDRSRSKPAAL